MGTANQTHAPASERHREIRVECQWRAKADGETMKGGRAEQTRIGRRDNIIDVVSG
jgi:hypothetical protein